MSIFLFFLDFDIIFFWNEWSDWFFCNKFCGGGLCKRLRECVVELVIKNSIECIGENKNVEICNIYLCRGMIWLMKMLLSY